MNPASSQHDIQGLADEELVSLFASTRNEKYFAELYRRYRHLSYGVCLKIMKNESDSLDVVSEVFRILFEKIPTANIKSFRSYIYTVSKNECIAKLRKRKTELTKMADLKAMQDKPLDFVENKKLTALLDNEPSMDAKVEEAVQKLRAEQQTCIRLFFYENKSYKEISAQTGYSEKQVKSYLQNGKRNLRLALEKDLQKLIA